MGASPYFAMYFAVNSSYAEPRTNGAVRYMPMAHRPTACGIALVSRASALIAIAFFSPLTSHFCAAT